MSVIDGVWDVSYVKKRYDATPSLNIPETRFNRQSASNDFDFWETSQNEKKNNKRLQNVSILDSKIAVRRKVRDFGRMNIFYTSATYATNSSMEPSPSHHHLPSLLMRLWSCSSSAADMLEYWIMESNTTSRCSSVRILEPASHRTTDQPAESRRFSDSLLIESQHQ